ncbi:MAG: flavodoxin-dependent (E)-4-hydroxy-3-methylbut-2-enyl-diphosphate synthase [Clostridia bacterium]
MKTREIKVKNIAIGGNSPITVQSMCNTLTEDVSATIKQILELESVGCDIVRVSVNNERAGLALNEIVKGIHIPLVADIHFDYKLAILSAENGASKIRINPGNIGGEQKVKYVADFLREREIPIRIGVNEGSLESEFNHLPRVDALVKSALKHITILEKANFYNTIVSIKSSNIKNMVNANKLFSEVSDYPLHIGVTEAGTFERGIIKNSVGIGALLLNGIGNTIRVSLADEPTKEVIAGKILLTSLGLKKGVEVIACPTCARTNIPVAELANKVEKLTASLDLPLKIAVMGCVVNGIGEAGDADFGVAGGVGHSILFKNGKKIKVIENDKIMAELEAMINEATNEKV